MYISFDIQIWSVIGSSSSLEVQGPIEACAPRSSEMTVAPWKCLFSCNCKKIHFFVAKFVKKKVFVAKMCKNDVFVAKICNCKIRCFLSRKFANARSALALREIWRSPLARQLIAACLKGNTCRAGETWSGRPQYIWKARTYHGYHSADHAQVTPLTWGGAGLYVRTPSQKIFTIWWWQGHLIRNAILTRTNGGGMV